MAPENIWKYLAIVAATSFGLSACGSEDTEKVTASESPASVEVATEVPDVKFKAGKEKYDGTVVKPGSPYSISYRIIGTPVVGSPVTVELQVESIENSQPLQLDYRINDATSMVFAESQPASVRMELADNEKAAMQRVTIVPQREGRFYLNVSASFETADGTMSTVTAIPIQVGTGTRELTPNGELQTDENGETVRVLTGEQ